MHANKSSIVYFFPPPAPPRRLRYIIVYTYYVNYTAIIILSVGAKYANNIHNLGPILKTRTPNNTYCIQTRCEFLHRIPII